MIAAYCASRLDRSLGVPGGSNKKDSDTLEMPSAGDSLELTTSSKVRIAWCYPSWLWHKRSPANCAR